MVKLGITTDTYLGRYFYGRIRNKVSAKMNTDLIGSSLLAMPLGFEILIQHVKFEI